MPPREKSVTRKETKLLHGLCEIYLPYIRLDIILTSPRYLFGGLIVVMVPLRYILYSNKDPASDHQHSGGSGVGPAGSEDHKDKYRDKRDTPNKGTR